MSKITIKIKRRNARRNPACGIELHTTVLSRDSGKLSQRKWLISRDAAFLSHVASTWFPASSQRKHLISREGGVFRENPK